MGSDVNAETFLSAVREEWDKAHGTIVVPAELELTHLEADGELLTLHVTDSAGSRFGWRTPLPAHMRSKNKTPGETGTPQHWALWEVLIPLVEELETNAATRLPPDIDGVRWISR